MSYILDALKKAESERNLGSVPNMYAQPMPGAASSADVPRWRRLLPWLLALIMFIILIAWIAWFQLRQQQSASYQNPAPVSAPPGAPVTPNPVSVVMSVATNPPHRSPAEKEMSAVDTTAAKAIPNQEHGSSEPTPPNNTAPTANPNIKNAASKATGDEEKRFGTLQDLPDNIQKELPVVVINGYIYAKNPADRSVLINKRLLHEGDQIAPDLVLEKMSAHGAILNYKGYRYQVSY